MAQFVAKQRLRLRTGELKASAIAGSKEATAAEAAAWTLAALSVLILAAGILSLRLYSPTHDLRAALVWRQTTLRSIPTEADTAQKTTPLSAGSIAIVDKNYLGWSRLAFPNGQTGWVRNEDLRHLWQ